MLSFRPQASALHSEKKSASQSGLKDESPAFAAMASLESGGPPSGSAAEPQSHSRALVIFGAYDISHLSPLVQYVALSVGLLLFMCLYGYYQELVAYGFFERRLSIFSTFIHFLGCFGVAQMQRKTVNSSKKLGALFTMGTASSRQAVFYYCLLILLKSVSQGLTNFSMTQINYPAKVLFKSANPIINMLIGLFWFRRSYPLRDYIVVALLVVGLYVFVIGDGSGPPEGTQLGISLVTIAMFCGAAVPMVQEHCINVYDATIEELLYHSFLGSTVISFFLSLVTGELIEGFIFLVHRADLWTWYCLIAFCVVGFAGSNFSTGLTLRFGSLVNGITNTARKAVTLGLSFALFPSRNHLSRQHILGAIIFFVGLIVRTLGKDKEKVKEKDAQVGFKKYEEANRLDHMISAAINDDNGDGIDDMIALEMGENSIVNPKVAEVAKSSSFRSFLGSDSAGLSSSPYKRTPFNV